MHEIMGFSHLLIAVIPNQGGGLTFAFVGLLPRPFTNPRHSLGTTKDELCRLSRFFPHQKLKHGGSYFGKRYVYDTPENVVPRSNPRIILCFPVHGSAANAFCMGLFRRVLAFKRRLQTCFHQTPPATGDQHGNNHVLSKQY